MAKQRMMGFGQNPDRLFKGDSLRNFGYNGVICGFEFGVASNGYRGTYLSCVEEISFMLDGKPIPEDKIVFFLNNKRFLLKHLKELYGEYWFTTDYATIRVYQDDGLGKGDHTIEYHVVTRVPFSGYFGSYHNADSTVSKKLALQEGKK